MAATTAEGTGTATGKATDRDAAAAVAAEGGLDGESDPEAHALHARWSTAVTWPWPPWIPVVYFQDMPEEGWGVVLTCMTAPDYGPGIRGVDSGYLGFRIDQEV